MTHAESQLWLLFKTIDRDHNERLSKAELRDAYREAGISLPQEKLDDFFHKIDRNHDGVISFDEWRYGTFHEAHLSYADTILKGFLVVYPRRCSWSKNDLVLLYERSSEC